MKTFIIKFGLFVLFLFRYTTVSFAQQVDVVQKIEKGIEAYQNMEIDKALSYLKPLETTFENFGEEAKAYLSFVTGSCYMQKQDYVSARRMFELVLTSSPSDVSPLFLVKPQLLTIYAELQDSVALARCVKDMEAIFNNPEFKSSEYYTDYAVSLSAYYQETAQYNKVFETAKKGLDAVATADADNIFICINKNTLFTSLGVVHSKWHKYLEAADDYKNALRYIQYTSQNIADAMSSIGNCYDYANMPDSALAYFEEAEHIYQQQNSPLTLMRTKNCLGLGVNLNLKNDCLRAQSFLETAEKGLLKFDDRELLAYVYAYLYNNTETIGNIELSKKYADQIKKYIKNVSVEDSRVAEICYSTYALILEREGKNQESISVMSGLLELKQQLADASPVSLATDCHNMAVKLIKTGELLQAEKYILKALELLDSYKELKKGSYIECTVLYGYVLTNTNRVGLAISALENIQEFVAQAVEEHSATARYYSSLSSLYADIGNYEKGLKYEILENEIIGKSIGQNSYSYAVSLLNLAEMYGVNEQIDKAEECSKKASEILRTLYGEDSKEYYLYLHKKTLKYTYNASTKETGEKEYSKCLRLSEKLFWL